MPFRTTPRAASLALLAAAALFNATALAQSITPITYQGDLKDNGTPANGTYDFTFTLYNAESAGSALAPPVCADNVSVVNGIFTISLQLPAITSGVPTYLQIGVRADTGQSCGNPLGFTTLTGRQPITPAPIAIAASAITKVSPSIPGALRYNSTAARFEGFTGQFWVPLTVGAALTPANIQDNTAPGFTNFTVPANVTRIGVDIWGGGGGGGGRSTLGNDGSCTITSGVDCAGSSGGSGAYMRAFLDVTPGEVLAIQVGSGGAAGSNDTNGGTGGTSIVFRGGTQLLRTNGGSGGQGNLLSNVVTSSTPCNGLITSGVSGGAFFFTGPGQLIDSAPGTAGMSARAPTCTGFPTNNYSPSCAGTSVAGPTASAPLTGTAGASGNGSSIPTANATAGSPGRVRIWWD
jgi:hypothetical protein